MEEQRQVAYAEDEIELAIYFAAFRKVWWKVVAFSLAVGVVTLVVTFFIPNTYQATAVITTPTVEEGKKNAALGALAFLGINLGGPSTVEDLDTLFKSDDLTARVFKNHDLWSITLGDRYDSSNGNMKLSWIGRLFGNEDPGPPGDWDAIRLAKKKLKVSINKRADTVSLSFESPSAEASASIVQYYLEEGKSRLQEEALERAMKNKRFIEEQIAKTHDALTKERLYSMYGQEVEKEMMARNREQFGFRIIDSPRVPDRKFKPRRGLSATLAAIFSFFAGCVYFIARASRKPR